MAFTIDDALLPAILTAQPMTDEQFAELCSEHPDLFFEMSAEGELIVMPPNHTLTAYRHRAILTQLDRWAQTGVAELPAQRADSSFRTARAARPTRPGRSLPGCGISTPECSNATGIFARTL